jgi:hypothetical protein
MRKTILGMGTLALLAPAPALPQAGQGEAEQNWAAIARCAAIDQADERHACMDQVIRRAGLLSEARVAQAARQEFGNENRAEPERTAPAAPPAPTPAAAPAETQVASPRPARAAELDELVTTVVSAQVRGDRRLVVTTAEGSVWEQTQSESFRNTPEAGSRFAIERTSLGGFRCSFERSSHYRCRRID